MDRTGHERNMGSGRRRVNDLSGRDTGQQSGPWREVAARIGGHKLQHTTQQQQSKAPMLSEPKMKGARQELQGRADGPHLADSTLAELSPKLRHSLSGFIGNSVCRRECCADHACMNHDRAHLEYSLRYFFPEKKN